MSTTVEALQAWNAHPPHIIIRIRCPFPSWFTVEGRPPLPRCKTVLEFDARRARMSIRQKARSVLRSHLLRHYELGTRDRSLLLDDAVEEL